jgi:hypothetical protein
MIGIPATADAAEDGKASLDGFNQVVEAHLVT